MKDAVYLSLRGRHLAEAQQPARILAYLREHNLEVPVQRRFCDAPTGYEGDSTLAKLLELVLERKVNRVFVATPEDFGREDYRDWMPLTRVLASYGAALVSVQEGDLSTHPLAAQLECPEFEEMLAAIQRGAPLLPGEGWYHAGQSRHGWTWLADRHGVDPKGVLTPAAFQGSSELFERLDRQGDGVLSAADFDWWSVRNGGQRRPGAGGQHEIVTRLESLLRGELGSPWEGPGLGQRAPEFSLPRSDGQGNIALTHYCGGRPCVLVFGVFT
jgi:hypothetical protein